MTELLKNIIFSLMNENTVIENMKQIWGSNI